MEIVEKYNWVWKIYNKKPKMKIIFLLPPSEGKKSWWEYDSENLSYFFDKPYSIAKNATGKDLKCIGKRYDEWIEFNRNIEKWPFCYSINRYSGVMYNAIDYIWMNNTGKKFFEDHFVILSGVYWILKPLDVIWNYKLPIETKWLLKFWWDKTTNKLIDLNPDYIVNLLPLSYGKMIQFSNLNSKVININFLKPDWKKISHWVKKYRWEWVKNICDKCIVDYNDFWWEVIKSWNNIDVNIIIS